MKRIITTGQSQQKRNLKEYPQLERMILPRCKRLFIVAFMPLLLITPLKCPVDIHEQQLSPKLFLTHEETAGVKIAVHTPKRALIVPCGRHRYYAVIRAVQPPVAALHDFG
ncbi:hypothetical protein LOAG_02871 [Loa loa]|uniref:Uncharacterized protein n=1 Tax=Loa loa TaxID=7209 RepID=A0A1S0U5X1_LOALO|nr:hypothetical protein LOAG_02871 [Loa loa]EFO25615.1 hypothetical protein LOAG_02871 [Loa loa]